MDTILGSIRTQLLSHPLLLLFALLLLSAAVPRPANGARRGLGFSLIALLVYGATVAWYVSVPQYFDHAEPSIAAVSWLAVNGGELYHRPDAAVCYAHPYGPLLYFTNGFALSLAGPGIAASKVAGAIAAVGSLVLLFLSLGREASRRERVTVIGFVAAVYLAFGNMTFWTRAEPQLLFLVALSLFAVTRASVVAALLAGVAAGAGVNLKATAALCFLPAAACIYRKHGLPSLLVAAIVATAVAAAPFILFRNVSFEGYLYWLSEASRHGFRMRSLSTQMQWAAVLLAPAAAAIMQQRWRDSTMSGLQLARVATIAGIAATIPFAMKHGAGIHHFIPFIPAVAFTAPRRGRLIGALAVLTVAVAAAQQAYWIGTVMRFPPREPIAELRRFESLYGNSIAIGYSPAYRLSFFRPLLVFDGHPYELDAPALMSHELAGEPFPRASTEAMASCSTNVWLIPRGGDPFDLRSAYSGGASVFPPEFIAAFQRSFHRVESGRYFDVWQCNRR